MKKYQRPLVLISVIAILFAISEFYGLRETLSVEYVRTFFDNHFILGFALFCLLFTLGNLIQIPGLIFLASAVLTFGRELGGVITYGAAVISCMACFLLIRGVGKDSLRRLPSKVAKRILEHLDKNPIRAVLGVRVIFQTAPAINYALALSGIRFRHHLLGTLFGLPLPILLYCIFFDYVAKTLNLAGV